MTQLLGMLPSTYLYVFFDISTCKYLLNSRREILLSIVFALRSEMRRIEKKEVIASATSLTATTILVIAGIATAITITTTSHSAASAQSFIDSESNLVPEPKAPMAVSQSGNNVYIVWWTNKSENWEVMFRASHDGGQTFEDKINLSNSSDAESQNAEIIAAGRNVFISWWETNPENGSSESMLRVSRDAGETFGPVMMLGMNGTISTTSGNATGAHAHHMQ
jgi:hypothetical protein